MTEWTYKYQPKTPKEYIGIRTNLQTMMNFLDRWSEDNPLKNALILYGQPGNGKTSLIYCLESTYNLNVIEVNASNQRNMKDIKSLLPKTAVNAFGDKTTVLLLDECDGIGVWQAIEDLINYTMCPIIMTCNNLDVIPYNVTKQCLSLEVKYPSTNMVVDLLKRVLTSEKPNVKWMDNNLETIAINCISVRQSIITLQWCILNKSFRRINVHDVDYSEYEQISKLFEGVGCTFNLTAETIRKWAMANNVNMHRLDKMINLARTFPNMTDITREYSLTLRGNIDKLKSPYYKKFKSFKRDTVRKKPKKEYKAPKEKKTKIEKNVLIQVPTFENEDVW